MISDITNTKDIAIMSKKAERHRAAIAGENKFFTGKPCKYGHIAFRYMPSGSCSECTKEYAKNNRQMIKDLMKSSSRKGKK